MRRVFVCPHGPTRQRVAQFLTGFEVLEEFPEEPADLSIRWGGTSGTDGYWAINPRQAVERLLDWNDVAARLRINRIRAISGLTPRYRVYLFDLRTFAFARRTRRGWRLFRPRRTLREILAVRCRRALFFVGLHGGAVDVARRNGRLIVTRIDAGPVLSTTLAQRLAAAIRQYIEDRRYNPFGRRVKLGADPEFMMRRRSNGRFVAASRFFPFRGMVGYDRLLRRRYGGRPLVELRPAPAEEPQELFENLRRAMRRAIARTGRRIAFSAGSLPRGGFPIGGHIHFSGIPFTSEFLWALDTYLGITMLLIENPQRASRRRRRYGYLGDFRIQRHGGFEYRTLPSWVVSPTVALAVLSLAKIIALEYHRLPNPFHGSTELMRDFYRANKEPFYRLFPELWENLTLVPSYQRYAQAIQPLKQLIDNRETWPDHADIKRLWMPPRPRRRRRRRLKKRRHR